MKLILVLVSLSLGAAAYFGSKREKSTGRQIPEVEPGIVGVLAVIMTAVSAYVFAQVPAVVWEVGTGMILGSFILRRFFHSIQ